MRWVERTAVIALYALQLTRALQADRSLIWRAMRHPGLFSCASMPTLWMKRILSSLKLGDYIVDAAK